MEALSRKTEKEKLLELEQMLADATTLTGDPAGYVTELVLYLVLYQVHDTFLRYLDVDRFFSRNV